MMSSFRLKSTDYANAIVAAILFLVPFHAFLTVWGSTLVGHYELLRLWDEVLLGVLTLITLVWLIRDKQVRNQLFEGLIFRLIAAYVLLTVALALIALSKHEVTMKAAGYALVVNLRYLLFFVAVGLLVQRSGWLARNWSKVVAVSALIVSLFAVLQLTVLPHNFLSHFGYGPNTIAPIETINHNAHYIRVESTLRGANPLGAYLTLVLGLVGTMLFVRRRQVMYLIVSVLSVLALLFTSSRSAWIGTVLAVAVVTWLQLKTRRVRVIAGVSTIVLIAILGSLFLVFRNNSAVENAVLHTDNHSTVAVSSNQAHASALKGGIHDIVHEPFGRGPGTAGPASYYNTGHQARIAENYFVQIAQETGWAGLILLVGIMVTVAIELYRYRELPLARGLLAALVGITFINLLSHAWTDDTLAYIWWGLAGIACAFQPNAMRATMNKHERNTNKRTTHKEAA